MEISSYRMTIIAAVVVLVLSVGLVTVLGGSANAATYLGLVGSIAVPGLFALFRMEKTAQQVAVRHTENQAVAAATNEKIDALAAALDKKGAP